MYTLPLAMQFSLPFCINSTGGGQRRKKKKRRGKKEKIKVFCPSHSPEIKWNSNLWHGWELSSVSQHRSSTSVFFQGCLLWKTMSGYKQPLKIYHDALCSPFISDVWCFLGSSDWGRPQENTRAEVRAEAAQSGTQGAGDEQSPNPATLGDGRGGQGRAESWEVTVAQAGMNGRQLINPRNAAPERKTCSLPEQGFQSPVGKQICEHWNFLTQPLRWQMDVLGWGDKWMCWAAEHSPWEWCARGGEQPQPSPAGIHYKSSVTCSGVSLIPMPWVCHGHTPEPTLTQSTEPRCPSWPGLAETMGGADLHRNTDNNHNPLICTHSIMLPASFLAFGSKCIAALTTSTFSTKDSVIKYSRLQHTINQSSLPVRLCNSALWKHLGTISCTHTF